jgi:GAF domain-containing protein
MLANHHRLKIGEGMIGWCIENAQARIALDIGEDAVRFDNPFLPETRSEGALPLRSRGRVLGALTVQSNQPAAFDQDIINTLQTMADQIAITIENADLFAKFVEARDAEQKAYGELSIRDWHSLTKKQFPKFVVSADGNLRTIKEQQSHEELQVIPAEQIVQDNGRTVIQPIMSYGHVLGGIKIRKSAKTGKWTADQLELVNTLSEQLSVALENARLLEEAQRRAAREQAIGEITASISGSSDVDTILRTAIQELGNKIGNTEVIFELGTE